MQPLLTYEATGIIRRIPVETRGKSKKGVPWTRGGVQLEVYEDGREGSALLFLYAWGDEMVETINMLGVGKRVRVRFRIESHEYYDKLTNDVVLIDINGLTEQEDFIYGTNRDRKP